MRKWIKYLILVAFIGLMFTNLPYQWLTQRNAGERADQR